MCINGIYSGKFRVLYVYYPQFLLIDFVRNIRAGMKLLCQGFCLLNDVPYLSMLFLETTDLFQHYALLWQLVIQPHVDY
jgi:hypothetical protein